MLECVSERLCLLLLDIEDTTVHGSEGTHAFDLGVDILRHVPAEDRPDQADTLECLSRRHLNLVRDVFLLTVEERARSHFFLVTAGDERQCLQEGLLLIAVAESGELLRSGFKQR